MWGHKGLGLRSYLWLEITVDDTVLAQKLERLQQLSTKAKSRNVRQDSTLVKLSEERGYNQSIDQQHYRLMSPRLKPWKELLLINSYKFMESNSDAMQRWLRK